MSTSEAAARKERDPTMEEREEEGMGELGEGGGPTMSSQERVPTVEEKEEGTGEHDEGSGGIPMSSQERVPTVEEREEGTGEHDEGSGGIPVSRSPEFAFAHHLRQGGGDRASALPRSLPLKKRKVTLKEIVDNEEVMLKESVDNELEGSRAEHSKGGGRLSEDNESSVVSFAAAARPWKDKRKRSSRARLCDQLPKPSKVGFDSMVSQAAEIIQERRGTAHSLEGLDGVAKLKKVLPEAAHLTGRDSLMSAAADFLERHPD